MNEGVLLTDLVGRIVYANGAYGELVGATDPKQVHSVERAFSGNADATEAIYRIAQLVREGSSGEEEVRMPGPLNPPSTISITRLPVSSRPSPMGGSSISTRRWRSGWASTSRASSQAR
jgi:two-component system cell cycle sensor histidine kinase/response regulator CckA